MAWLTGWLYRKKLTITGTADGAQTSYCMGIKVYYGSGTDGTEALSYGKSITFGKVYCDSKCEAGFGDIRFTSSDGESELSYFIETSTASTSATIWVKLNTIPASPDTTDIYIYYGNSGASTTSSGDNTLAFYEQNGYTDEGWTLVNGSYSTIDVGAPYDNVMAQGVAYNGSHQCYRGLAYNVSRFHYWVDMKLAITTYGSWRYSYAGQIITEYNNATNEDWAASHQNTTAPQQKVLEYFSNGALIDLTILDEAFTRNIWYKFHVYVDSGHGEYYENNDLKATVTESTSDTYAYLRLDTWREQNYYDNLFMRKYSDTEPTHTSWGEEEPVSTGDCTVSKLIYLS